MAEGYINKAKRDDYETPDDLFRKIDAVFHFGVDLACSVDNCKCSFGNTKGGLVYFSGIGDGRYTFMSADNSLGATWHTGIVGWLNPPYGLQIRDWIRKAHEEVNKNNIETVVMLIPSATEKVDWHRYIFTYARYLIFINKRVVFELDGKPVMNLNKKTGKWEKAGSGKGSALVVFTKKDIPEIYQLSEIGFVIDLDVQRGEECWGHCGIIEDKENMIQCEECKSWYCKDCAETYISNGLCSACD